MKKLFPDDEVYRTETFNVGQDWEIPIVGFFIIGANDPSKRTVMDFTEAQVQDLGTLIRTIRIAMKEVLHITDVYLFQNEDTDHGFHVWLFPRHEWMEQFGRKIESVRPIMNYALEAKSAERDVAEVKDAARRVREYLTTI